MAAKDWDGGISKLQRMRLESIVNRVIGSVKPTPQEMNLITSYSNSIMRRLKKAVPDDVEIIFVGSAARGTQIRGSYDIDIFMLFPKTLPEREMEKKGLQMAKSIVDKGKGETFVIKYAEHPYLKLMVDSNTGLSADIVPAFKISHASEMGTSVDRTQLHNKFVSARLTDWEKDNVRALKAFLKGHNLYGANAKIEGFSGYSCELMVYQFGSFINVLQEFAKLNLPTAIDPLNRETYKPHHERTEILAKKFKNQFVVIDPTDENRNVTAATSVEAMARMCVVSRLMLQKPSIDLFYGARYSDTYSENKMSRLRKELGMDVYSLSFDTPDISEDIVWQQTRRLSKRFETVLKDNAFVPALTLENVSKEKTIIAFLLGRESKHYDIIEGPSAFMHIASDRFLQSHRTAIGTFFKGDRITFIEESAFKNPGDVLRNAVKSEKSLPSYIDRKKIRMHVNDIPEDLAKLLYEALVRKTSI